METPTMASSARAASYYNPDEPIEEFIPIRQLGMNAAGIVRNTRPIFQMQAQELQVIQRRVIQVMIADTNQNVPLDQCLLYKGEEKLTDATDQELFFEIGIKELLDIHNAKRIKIVDKTIKDRTEYLEQAKVRDLKMVVVTVAVL